MVGREEGSGGLSTNSMSYHTQTGTKCELIPEERTCLVSRKTQRFY